MLKRIATPTKNIWLEIEEKGKRKQVSNTTILNFMVNLNGKSVKTEEQRFTRGWRFNQFNLDSEFGYDSRQPVYTESFKKNLKPHRVRMLESKEHFRYSKLGDVSLVLISEKLFVQKEQEIEKYDTDFVLDSRLLKMKSPTPGNSTVLDFLKEINTNAK